MRWPVSNELIVFSPTPERRATSFWLRPRRRRSSLSFNTRSIAPPSEAPHQTDDHALHRDVSGRGIDRTHHRVRRLQADAFSFAVNALERDFSVDVGHDHLAVVGELAAGDDDQVAVQNPVLD